MKLAIFYFLSPFWVPLLIERFFPIYASILRHYLLRPGDWGWGACDAMFWKLFFPLFSAVAEAKTFFFFLGRGWLRCISLASSYDLPRDYAHLT